MASVSTIFKKAIEKYSGKKVKTIKVHSDPQVEGTYAIRTKFEGRKENQDWLICRYESSWDIAKVEENLEECEYETWPPASGRPRFF